MTKQKRQSPNPPPPARRDREREQWALLGRVLLGMLARRQAGQGQEMATEPERNAPEA
ncbi:hypothetical protein [Chloroflexus aurantiacus]|jgi:hypothetical protein|uniref:hypothetical protein n=1 Tax=Chloroflexus aurantiacus TaxID=1108 RepID=UPI0000458D6D|nr:hypothetical protein [Chloroflexus aurantiacus]GIV89878.1 MAG: hypothetical protein KatS3mg055_2396 [Chloroflexus sp.]